MPNLQLSAKMPPISPRWIISVPGEWPVKVERPARRLARKSRGARRTGQALRAKGGSFNPDGKSITVVRSARSTSSSDEAGADEKLLFLGEKTISRLGCFGCHAIPGFENAKPIGTPLNGWGIKCPARLDYGHITEYLDDQEQPRETAQRDGTDQFYQEKIMHETRARVPLREAAPAPELRLSEEEREVQDVGRSPSDAPVRLGQRSRRPSRR